MDSSWLTPTVLFCFLNLIIISIFINAYYSTKSHKNQLAQPQLNRSSSLFARVKSISFSKKYFDPFQPQTNDIPVTQEVVPEEKLSVSDPEEKLSISEEPVKTVPSEQEEKKEQLIKTSTTSVKERKKNKTSGRREAAVVKTVSFKGDEQVDAKADDFINRFKQQLKIQRIDSIKRYTEMLTGSGASSAN
ncbi:pathogen-associated molecular patterns-induced protein A70-like [Heracleum sosnowskyi]|uniref:Pathogen-associated molecular patterns-induced protein A70-like n=1 Tax=Heracleum sosnowskyi TaxID=360622 RepID=A0AAD8M7M1_9APIA|nr:pathogen-associated molecular patterns-induced protein A70-like [Heracleum sosnowskyi]